MTICKHFCFFLWMYTEKFRHTELHQTHTSQSQCSPIQTPNQSNPLPLSVSLQSASCWAITKRYTKETLHKNAYHLSPKSHANIPCFLTGFQLMLWTGCVFSSYSWSVVRAAISICKRSLMWPKRIWSRAKTCTRQTESN